MKNNPPHHGAISDAIEAIENEIRHKGDALEQALAKLNALRDAVPDETGNHLERMCNQTNLTQADMMSLIVLAKLLHEAIGGDDE